MEIEPFPQCAIWPVEIVSNILSAILGLHSLFPATKITSTRRNHQRFPIEKTSLKNFAKFSVKHLCRCRFFKKTPVQMFSSEFISLKTLICRTSTASEAGSTWPTYYNCDYNFYAGWKFGSFCTVVWSFIIVTFKDFSPIKDKMPPCTYK